MIGTTIGKYRIVGLLGRGATGIVYRAVDDTLDREVAIKVLNPHFAVADIMKRFRAEATILAKLSHPEIATIHELLQTDGDLLMVMELVRGETLENLSTRVGAMSPVPAARLLDGILSALDHAHRAGIVHRDLKPANVMVTQLGGIKIMDFGIARVRGAEHMTIDGCAVGTPAYMPPEQVLGEEIDGRADLYAVGVILYRLLTGKLPFDADTPMVMLQKQIAELPAPLHVHRQELPEWCESVVQRALAKAPDDRFQTAEEFRVAIGLATGLAPAIDLAKAFAIGADETVGASLARSPLETVAVSPTQAEPAERRNINGSAEDKAPPQTTPSPEPADARTQRLPPHVPTILMRAKRFASTREGTARLGGIAAAICIVAYLAGNPLPIDSGPSRPSERGTEERRASTIDSRIATQSGASTPTSSARRPAAGSAGRQETRTTSAAPTPLVFRTKIVRARGGEPRDEDARLSLADDRLTVAAYSAPEEPVFSVPYRNITAIHHSREPAWKPPQGLSKVIKVESDVLDAFGIRDRHHVSLYTDSEDDFVVLRVDERLVSKLLKELKQRTGRDPERGSKG